LKKMSDWNAKAPQNEIDCEIETGGERDATRRRGPRAAGGESRAGRW
jgi:hypothetical protein